MNPYRKRRLGALAFSLLLLFLSACDQPTDPKVASCQKLCESNQSLQTLDKKVMYKPVKLCKKRCEATGGTCQEAQGAQMDHRLCVFYGMNAGSMSNKPLMERGIFN